MADSLNKLEATHATLIGVLLVNAKFLQMALKKAIACEADSTRETSGDHVHFLLTAVSQLTRADGDQLERDTLDLAKILGFEVQQTFLRKQTESVQ